MRIGIEYLVFFSDCQAPVIEEMREDSQEMKQTAEEGGAKEAVTQPEIIEDEVVTQTTESADSMQTVTQSVECSEQKVSQYNEETLQIVEG